MNRNITDDSRQVKEDSIFLVTPQNERFLATLPKHIPTIQREDLKQYYCTNIKIIGITGTNGKTTTAAAIYSMLLDMGYNVALLGTRGMFVNNKQIKPKGLTTPKLLELYQDIDIPAGPAVIFCPELPALLPGKHLIHSYPLTCPPLQQHLQVFPVPELQVPKAPAR